MRVTCGGRTLRATIGAAALAVAGAHGAWAQRALPPACELPLPGAGAGATQVADTAALELRVNLPAYRVDVLERGVVTRSYPLAIGSWRYPSVTGAYAIRRIVWNPWWYPPNSWWARKDTVTPPGPTNPMGKVKIQLGDAPVFLHGTPSEASVGRAASHGCFRMRTADVVALARLVLDAGGAHLDDGTVARFLASWRDTATVSLGTPVPVRVVYELAEVVRDSLLLHRNVYDRGSETLRALAARALAAAGVDTLWIDRPRLDSLVKAARRRAAGVPLAALRAEPPR